MGQHRIPLTGVIQARITVAFDADDAKVSQKTQRNSNETFDGADYSSTSLTK
jgi:hypothetical protein